MAHIKSWQFLSAALVGTIVYALLSMTVGSDGVWCYKQLEEQRRIISSRATSIQKINDELTKERMALERDKSVIAAYAHRLEYVKDNEKLIKITGLKPYESTLYDTGTPLKAHGIKCMSEAACKAAGFAFFVFVSLIMLLFDIASMGHDVRRQYTPASGNSTILRTPADWSGYSPAETMTAGKKPRTDESQTGADDAYIAQG